MRGVRPLHQEIQGLQRQGGGGRGRGGGQQQPLLLLLHQQHSHVVGDTKVLRGQVAATIQSNRSKSERAEMTYR